MQQDIQYPQRNNLFVNLVLNRIMGNDYFFIPIVFLLLDRRRLFSLMGLCLINLVQCLSTASGCRQHIQVKSLTGSEILRSI